ncbi:type III pantothenate kinase [Salinibacter altiplanensis]|uniref:type III pantothenate kinase n=1 Tax=Salinibacter altiplanensis TaxID=1803181 RepID=UPI000C9FD5CA|nr:type III pantothenate kinase [Salinibacter altiplanensis]
MLLTIDVGNSAVKAGLFSDEGLDRVFSVDAPDEASDTAAHWRALLASLLPDEPVGHIGLVSVVPPHTDAVARALQALMDDAPTTIIGPEGPLPFVLDYETPDTLGTDRLAAAAAAWEQYGRGPSRSVIVVDAGTAVNYEVIHRSGTYQGGAIGPGAALMRNALQAGTAQLPEVSLRLPETPLGTSTQTALQSGILWGLVDSMQGMTTRLADRLPDTPRFVLTGGWSDRLTHHLGVEAVHAPHLVLRGARLLTEMRRA